MLYKHQEAIIKDDRPKVGIFTGTGSGKTLTALVLSKEKVLVICPKTQFVDGNWPREAKKNNLDVDLTVISKETFRRDWDKLGKFNTIIIDEAHTVLGATPSVRYKNRVAYPKVSQLFEALMSYVEKHNPERIYPCTATITRSPMVVWACGQLLGKDWDFFKFRDLFYFRLKIPGRDVWTTRNDSKTKDELAKLVMRLGYTGKLSDFFDVPEQTFRDVFVENTVAQEKRLSTIAFEYPDPLVLLGKRLQIENGLLNGDEFNQKEIFSNEKLDKIIDYSYEFPRMIVFAKYLHQIEEIKKALKHKKVFIMTGDTKDRGELLKQVNECDDYAFVVSAQISAGWEAPKCDVMVFASRTYSIVDYVQAQGRIHRANHLKKNLYINLITKDGVDHAVHKALENKQDFSERIYLNI